jgi:hypothetical protein
MPVHRPGAQGRQITEMEAVDVEDVPSPTLLFHSGLTFDRQSVN